MCYIVSEICIGRRFTEECFYCYSQQIIPIVAKESLISHNLTKRAPEIHNFSYCNTIYYPKPSQTKRGSVFELKILFHTNINNKNTFKIVCRMQCFKIGMQFNVSDVKCNV